MIAFYDSRLDCLLTGRLKIDQSPIMEELTQVDIETQEVKKVTLISGLMSMGELESAKEILVQAGFYLADIIDANDPAWYQYIYIRPERIQYAESANEIEQVENDTVVVLPDGYIIAITDKRGNKITHRMRNNVLIEL
ncbi:hypothetical protein BECAL_02307 [Bellilinea caldifistulae]|uniref:Uncharacterized protein n=1 Tax=Bellilinea caldifistulae TaxID=360411 RepID=A0A0P6X2I4_9CHLR|nr:hypothetical protein [Bellilinea caldifistulae]KPL73841.1 hypothetical protein AC812_13710 [Bellilinea caldifistulae]GAP11122.1 hypothetical protein BECAL_02307 [Bellilinea caldifistulae]